MTANCALLKKKKKKEKKICLSASNCAEKTADASITSALLQSWGESRRSLSAFCTPVGIKETALLIPPFYLPFTARTFSNPAVATSLFPRLLFHPLAVPPALGALQELLGAIPAVPGRIWRWWCWVSRACSPRSCSTSLARWLLDGGC